MVLMVVTLMVGISKEQGRRTGEGFELLGV